MQSIDIRPGLIILVYLKALLFWLFNFVSLSYICLYTYDNVFYITESSINFKTPFNFHIKLIQIRKNIFRYVPGVRKEAKD
jgi:hypothetical protein